MSDRRRNIFVLLTVVGLLAASLAVIFTKETKLGLDLQGGVQLVFQGKPTKQQPEVTPDGLDRALDIMRERVDTLGVAEPELQRSGSDQIDVSLPGVADPERAAEIVGTTAQLYFYDWEPNILDEDCKTNPDSVNGGQQAISGLFNAVQRASKCPPEVDGNNTADGPSFYAFDKDSNAPLNEGIPSESEEDLRESLEKAGESNFKILEVPEGVIVVRAPDERTGDQRDRGEVDQWWVLKDNPVLNGNEIKNPEQNFENGAGGAPIVTMEFSDKGREAFAADDPRDRPARPGQRGPQRRPAEPDRGLAPLRDPARQRAHLDAVHQLPREPGRDRRLPGRPDLRRLHAPERPGPGAAAQDRRPAAAARADLALAGLRDARPAGARPGPQGRPRGLR